MKLNVGCGRNIKEGWVNLDSARLPGVDLIADLDLGAKTRVPLKDDCVDEFLLSHVIEHIKSPLPLMEELYRVAKPGAKMEIRVPYGSSDDAWEDPTHVRPYFLGSFCYFAQPFYWRADYGYRGDWQATEIVLRVNNGFRGIEQQDTMRSVFTLRNVVLEMVCTLEAVKPIREPLPELRSQPRVGISFT